MPTTVIQFTSSSDENLFVSYAWVASEFYIYTPLKHKSACLCIVHVLLRYKVYTAHCRTVAAAVAQAATGILHIHGGKCGRFIQNDENWMDGPKNHTVLFKRDLSTVCCIFYVWQDTLYHSMFSNNLQEYTECATKHELGRSAVDMLMGVVLPFFCHCWMSFFIVVAIVASVRISMPSSFSYMPYHQHQWQQQ